MTSTQLFARATHYHVDPSKREQHYRDLQQADRVKFWTYVYKLRIGTSVPSLARGLRDDVKQDRSDLRPLWPMQADRLRREFWADQTATPRTLP